MASCHGHFFREEQDDDGSRRWITTTLSATQSPNIRAYIAGMGVPRHDVDDVAQDVYMELYRFFDRMPAEVQPRQWLKGIARNLCLNYFRRNSRRSRLQREALVEIFLRAEQEGGGVLERRAGAARAGWLLQKLPPAEPQDAGPEV